MLGVCALLPAGNGTLLFFDLHRFFIAIARVAVNEDGHSGSVPHSTVWDEGAKTNKRRVLQALWEFVWVPGLPDLWRHGSVGWPCIHVGAAEVASRPYSVGMLVKLCAFLVACIGLQWFTTLVHVAYRMWKYSSLVSVRPGSGLSWSQQFPSLGGVDVQFRCRLFRLDRASIFGVPVGFWVLCCGLETSCLVDLAALSPAVFVLTIAGFGGLGCGQYGQTPPITNNQ